MEIRKNVSLAIPIADSVDHRVLQSMLGVVNYSAINGINIVDIGVTHRQMIDDARNNLTETFLGTPTEWLFWMDSDMTFPKDTLVELFKVAEEKDAKMVTGVYYQRKGLNFPVLWSRGDELDSGRKSCDDSKRAESNKYIGSFMFPHPDKQEPALAHAAGFGCVLVHRTVFEMLDRPWFKFVPRTCSEDFYFFVNAQEAGFKLWYTPKPELGHIGDSPIITKKDFHRNLEKSNLDIDGLKRGEKNGIA
jgi:hypothetical protein